MRVLYVVPADKDFRDDYSDGIQTAILDVQGWFWDQLDGATFQLHRVEPERCVLPHIEAHYTGSPAWQEGDVRGAWDIFISDLQHCALVEWDTDTFTWVLYFDITETCASGLEILGRGGGGIAMMSQKDLEGLAGSNIWPRCDGTTYTEGVPTTIERWYGGLAHELAHALHVPHPPGCDERLDTCDYDALMAWGYADYPDTYFTEGGKAILIQSPFIH